MKKYTQYFISSTRNDGASYLYLSDTAPVELREFVCEVHMELDCMPNDWIYEQIHNALELAERDEDLTEAFVEPDCYTADLKRWTLEPFADQFLDEALEHCEPFENYFKLLSWAQYEAIRRIYDLTATFIDEHNEEEAE